MKHIAIYHTADPNKISLGANPGPEELLAYFLKVDTAEEMKASLMTIYGRKIEVIGRTKYSREKLGHISEALFEKFLKLYECNTPDLNHNFFLSIGTTKRKQHYVELTTEETKDTKLHILCLRPWQLTILPTQLFPLHHIRYQQPSGLYRVLPNQPFPAQHIARLCSPNNKTRGDMCVSITYPELNTYPAEVNPNNCHRFDPYTCSFL